MAQPPAAAAVSVRPYQPADYGAVLPIWQRGFRELSRDAHRDLSSAPVMGAAAAAAGAALLSGRPVAAAAVLLGAGLLRTPLGEAAIAALMDLAIARETARDMTPEALATRWAAPGGGSAFFVAEAGGVVVGCVGVLGKHTLYKEARRRPPPAGSSASAQPAQPPREASIWRLSVAPAARRLGVGRALVAAAEAWAAAHAYERLSLLCGNAESKRFYAAIGYAPLSLERAAALLGLGAGEQLGALDRLKLAALRRRVARGNLLGKQLGG